MVHFILLKKKSRFACFPSELFIGYYERVLNGRNSFAEKRIEC